MVKTKKKKKVHSTSDFTKVKNKVGKAKKPAANATNTNFKSKALFMPSQTSISDNKQGVNVNMRNLTLNELLRQTKHHNVNVKKEALIGLADFFQRHPSSLQPYLNTILSDLLGLLLDTDSSVRSQLYSLLSEDLFPVLDTSSLDAFGSFVLAHTSSALTHVSPGIRKDGLKLLELLLKLFPSLVLPSRLTLIPRLIDLLTSSHFSASTSSTHTHSMTAATSLSTTSAVNQTSLNETTGKLVSKSSSWVLESRHRVVTTLAKLQSAAAAQQVEERMSQTHHDSSNNNNNSKNNSKENDRSLFKSLHDHGFTTSLSPEDEHLLKSCVPASHPLRAVLIDKPILAESRQALLHLLRLLPGLISAWIESSPELVSTDPQSSHLQGLAAISSTLASSCFLLTNSLQYETKTILGPSDPASIWVSSSSSTTRSGSSFIDIGSLFGPAKRGDLRKHILDAFPFSTVPIQFESWGSVYATTIQELNRGHSSLILAICCPQPVESFRSGAREVSIEGKLRSSLHSTIFDLLSNGRRRFSKASSSAFTRWIPILSKLLTTSPIMSRQNEVKMEIEGEDNQSNFFRPKLLNAITDYWIAVPSKQTSLKRILLKFTYQLMIEDQLPNHIIHKWVIELPKLAHSALQQASSVDSDEEELSLAILAFLRHSLARGDGSSVVLESSILKMVCRGLMPLLIWRTKKGKAIVGPFSRSSTRVQRSFIDVIHFLPPSYIIDDLLEPLTKALKAIPNNNSNNKNGTCIYAITTIYGLLTSRLRNLDLELTSDRYCSLLSFLASLLEKDSEKGEEDEEDDEDEDEDEDQKNEGEIFVRNHNLSIYSLISDSFTRLVLFDIKVVLSSLGGWPEYWIDYYDFALDFIIERLRHHLVSEISKTSPVMLSYVNIGLGLLFGSPDKITEEPIEGYSSQWSFLCKLLCTYFSAICRAMLSLDDNAIFQDERKRLFFQLSTAFKSIYSGNDNSLEINKQDTDLIIQIYEALNPAYPTSQVRLELENLLSK